MPRKYQATRVLTKQPGTNIVCGLEVAGIVDEFFGSGIKMQQAREVKRC
jgi:hypothetical protein